MQLVVSCMWYSVVHSHKIPFTLARDVRELIRDHQIVSYYVLRNAFANIVNIKEPVFHSQLKGTEH